LTIPSEFWERDGAITLPPLSESVPEYYRKVVEECCSVGPNDRPSAWRLLRRFPPRKDSGISQNEGSRPETIGLGLRSMKKAFMDIRIMCTHCFKVVQESYFHCTVCDEGDFDMCLNCYSEGRHCYDGGHLLTEVVESEPGWTVSKRFHFHSQALGWTGNY